MRHARNSVIPMVSNSVYAAPTGSSQSHGSGQARHPWRTIRQQRAAAQERSMSEDLPTGWQSRRTIAEMAALGRGHVVRAASDDVAATPPSSAGVDRRARPGPANCSLRSAVRQRLTCCPGAPAPSRTASPSTIAAPLDRCRTATSIRGARWHGVRAIHGPGGAAGGAGDSRLYAFTAGRQLRHRACLRAGHPVRARRDLSAAPHRPARSTDGGACGPARCTRERGVASVAPTRATFAPRMTILVDTERLVIGVATRRRGW